MNLRLRSQYIGVGNPKGNGAREFHRACNHPPRTSEGQVVQDLLLQLLQGVDDPVVLQCYGQGRGRDRGSATVESFECG